MLGVCSGRVHARLPPHPLPDHKPPHPMLSVTSLRVRQASKLIAYLDTSCSYINASHPLSIYHQYKCFHLVSFSCPSSAVCVTASWRHGETPAKHRGNPRSKHSLTIPHYPYPSNPLHLRHRKLLFSSFRFPSPFFFWDA